MAPDGRTLGERPPKLVLAERFTGTRLSALRGVKTSIAGGAVPDPVQRIRLLWAHAGRGIGVASRHTLAGNACAQRLGVARGIVVAGKGIEQEPEARLVAGGNRALVGSGDLGGEGCGLRLVRRGEAEFGLHHDLRIESRRAELRDAQCR